MMTSELLQVTNDGHIRIVSMNRPDRLNAISEELHAALTGIWAQLMRDPEARAVILTGAGRAFSAGGDAEWLARISTDPEVRWKAIDEGGRLAREILRFPLPLVAAINGPAVGLGASLASLCDMVVMSREAFFSDTHTMLGIAAGDGVAATWPGSIGMQRAKEYILLGDRITADDAHRLGLVNRVVSPEGVMDEATLLANRLGALPKYAFRATKKALNLQTERSALGIIDFALAAESEHFSLPETVEKIQGMRR
jgi:enoyl-CoA hydratase